MEPLGFCFSWTKGPNAIVSFKILRKPICQCRAFPSHLRKSTLRWFCIQILLIWMIPVFSQLRFFKCQSIFTLFAQKIDQKLEVLTFCEPWREKLPVATGSDGSCGFELRRRRNSFRLLSWWMPGWNVQNKTIINSQICWCNTQTHKIGKWKSKWIAWWNQQFESRLG